MLREDLQKALKESMLNKDMTTVSAVRLIIAGMKEKDVIEKFLPKQMDDAEIEAVLKTIISSTGASSIKDMGKVMGELKAKYAGQLDMGKASGMIKSLLG